MQIRGTVHGSEVVSLPSVDLKAKGPVLTDLTPVQLFPVRRFMPPCPVGVSRLVSPEIPESYDVKHSEDWKERRLETDVEQTFTELSIPG